MKSGFVLSFAALVLGARLAMAQAPVEMGSDASAPRAIVDLSADSERLLPGPASIRIPRGSTPEQDIAAILEASEESEPCGSPCCCQQACGPPGRFWIGADYLLWWVKGYAAPPLVSSSAASSAGIAGPGTSVLFGGSNVSYPVFSGVRFDLGFWLNQQQTLGLEGGGFFLGSGSRSYSAGGDGGAGSPTIGRPFVNALTGQEDSELLAFPNGVGGTVNVNSSTRLAGGQINGLFNLCCGPGYRIDALGGFRYFQLIEGLGVTENLAVPVGVPVMGGSRYAVWDQFHTGNYSFSGQMGLRGMVYRGRLFALATGAVDLGVVNQIVDINGATTITSASRTAQTSSGGLLALPSNIGHYSQSRFAVLPQAGLDIGYWVTRSMYVSFGYSFLYLSKVVRPGDQIDRMVNPSQLPVLGSAGGLIGPARPTFQFQETDFWAQGMQFGLGFRF